MLSGRCGGKDDAVRPSTTPRAAFDNAPCGPGVLPVSVRVIDSDISLLGQRAHTKISWREKRTKGGKRLTVVKVITSGGTQYTTLVSVTDSWVPGLGRPVR